MSEQGSQKLMDLCEAIIDCEHKTAPKLGHGIPSIRTTDIKNGRIDFLNANKVSEETYKEWTARLEPQPGDLVLITGKGTEQSVKSNGQVYPWDDRKITREILKQIQS